MRPTHTPHIGFSCLRRGFKRSAHNSTRQKFNDTNKCRWCVRDCRIQARAYKDAVKNPLHAPSSRIVRYIYVSQQRSKDWSTRRVKSFFVLSIPQRVRVRVSFKQRSSAHFYASTTTAGTFTKYI